VTALVGAMAALGLVTRSGERFRLSPEAAELDPAHPRTVAGIVAKEWFFYRAWAGLPQTVRDGHARIAPWTERLAEDPATSLRFLGALDDLGARFGGELPELAGIPSPRRVLDAGGGSGVHAAHLQAHSAGLDVTVLDLAPVGALVAERHPELAFVAGDLTAERFGRPDGESWDVVLLANILHDVPPGEARAIVGRAVDLLGPGGALVVYEWLLDETRDAPPDVALFAVMMMVENEGGAAYTESEVQGWLTDAGLAFVETRRGHGPIAVVRGWKP
jgi:SAM-dependent methyltransferase